MALCLLPFALLFSVISGHRMFENALSHLRHELTAPFYTHIFNNDVYNQRSSAVDLTGCSSIDCFRSRLTVRILHYFIHESTLNEEESQVANAPLVNVLTMKQVVARYRSNTVIVGRILMMLGEEMRSQRSRQIVIYEAAMQCLDIEGFAPTPNHRLEFLHSSLQLLSELYTPEEYSRQLIYVTSRLLDDKLWLARTSSETKYLVTHRLGAALLHQGHVSSVISLVSSWLDESVVRDKAAISAMLRLQGQAYMLGNQLSLAEDAFRNALQFHSSVDAEVLLGQCLFAQRKWSEAAAVLENALPSPNSGTCSTQEVALLNMTLHAFRLAIETFRDEGSLDLEKLTRQRLERVQSDYETFLIQAAADMTPLEQKATISTSVPLHIVLVSLVFGVVIVLGNYLLRGRTDKISHPKKNTAPGRPAPSE